MPKVVIVYRFLPQYRVPFYEGLRTRLREDGIDLELIYGDGDADDRAKRDLVSIDWGVAVPNRIVRLGSAGLYWQPVLDRVRSADLIIVEQASRLLLNYLLLFGQRLGGPRVALWGHGRNFQADGRHRVAEWVKAFASKHAHWWFAYNQRSADVVAALGFPRSRISIVENAIDTTSLRTHVASISASERAAMLRRWQLDGSRLGAYVGGLYKEKCIPFLLDAARLLRDHMPGFELLIAGDGPQRDLVREAADRHAWVKVVGPTFGRDKAALLAAAQVMLLPGAVGLAVLDAFAAGLPLATTNVPFHGPEIAYLTEQVTGIVTVHEPHAYAHGVAALFEDSARLDRMRAAALLASQRYTIENMVERFAAGIRTALVSTA